MFLSSFFFLFLHVFPNLCLCFFPLLLFVLVFLLCFFPMLFFSLFFPDFLTDFQGVSLTFKYYSRSLALIALALSNLLILRDLADLPAQKAHISCSQRSHGNCSCSLCSCSCSLELALKFILALRSVVSCLRVVPLLLDKLASLVVNHPDVVAVSLVSLE